MDKDEWAEFNETLGKKVGSWVHARKYAKPIAPLFICDVAVHSLKVAAELSKKDGMETVFRWGDSANGIPWPLGPAEAVLQTLPDAATMSPEECAAFFGNLLEAAVDSNVPVQLFLTAYNYSMSLIPRFRDMHFMEVTRYEELESNIRRRLLTDECFEAGRGITNNENVLGLIYKQSLRRSADAYIRVGDHAGAVQSVLNELNANYPAHIMAEADVEYQRLFCAHYYNNLLGIFHPRELLQDAARVKLLTPEQQSEIEEMSSPTIEEIEISNFWLEAEGVMPRNASTHIILVVPAVVPSGNFSQGDWIISAYQIDDPFLDPNFRCLHEQSVMFGGIPLAALSPTLGKDTPVTVIELRTASAFHPDFSINGDGTPSERDCGLHALYGADFDPYLAKASEILLKLKSPEWQDREALVAALKGLDSYVVSYQGAAGTEPLNFFRPLGKASVFIAVRDRIANRFKQAIAGGSNAERLRQLITDHVAYDEISLRNFTVALFDELIARPSEHSDWWKTIWQDGSKFTNLRHEKDVCRDMLHVLRPWFTYKGLYLDGEVSASGGAIDFVATGSHAGMLSRCGVEVKYAHHQHIFDCVAKQLPDYMNDLDTRAGVLVILWCKGETFKQPVAYGSSSELVQALKAGIPSTHDIVFQTINAAFRAAPSKRRA